MNTTKINESKLKELYDSILNPLDIIVTEEGFCDSKEKFKVFTYEAGAGKTSTICLALKDLYKKDPTSRTLIVTKLNKEQDELKRKLGKIAKVVNSKQKIEESKLYKYPIIIITHELYKRLCRDHKRRKHYTKHRTNLIVDEQLDLLSVIEVTQDDIHKIREVLARVINLSSILIDLPEIWGKIVRPINDVISENYQKKMRFIYIEDENIDKKLDFLLNILKDSNKSKFHKDDISKKNYVIDKINSIRYIFNSLHLIAYNAKLYSYNEKVEYFKLKNNIILDASGKFLELYNLSDLYDVKSIDRTINHDKTTLTLVEENSTSSAINNKESYMKEVSEYIKSKVTSGDKTLIVGRESDREEMQHILSNDIEFVNFDAMRGKNDWSNFNKCFVIHLPNAIYHQYIYQYLFHHEGNLTEEDIEINKIGYNQGFVNNEKLEQLRITDVTSSIYQALKRVNRANNLECELYAIVKDKRIQDLLVEQFKGLKEIKREKIFDRKYDNSQRKKELRVIANKIKKSFRDMKVNQKIKKKQLRDMVGAKNRDQFIRALEEIEGEYLEDMGIKEVGHSYKKIS